MTGFFSSGPFGTSTLQRPKKGGTTVLLCLVVLLLAITLDSTPARAWNCLGHMTVAEIARRRISKTNELKADALARAFHLSGPFLSSPDMVQMACWPDDLKGWKQYSMSTWHYIDTPYNPEKVPLPPDHASDSNVVTASRAMVTALKAGSKSPQYNLNFALANLVHFLADVHQPLHATTLFSHKYPSGDRGGNAETVRAYGHSVKLHALWDGMCQEHTAHTPRPLSPDDYAAVRAFADRLEDTYKFPEPLRHVTDFEEMARESYEYAINTTYPEVEDGAELSEKYLDRCKRVTEARVTLAGFRLANLLNTLLEDIDVEDLDEVRERACHPKAGGTPGISAGSSGTYGFTRLFAMEVHQVKTAEGDARRYALECHQAVIWLLAAFAGLKLVQCVHYMVCVLRCAHNRAADDGAHDSEECFGGENNARWRK